MGWALAGPFCWLLGADGCGWDWEDRTAKLPLVGGLGPEGTAFLEERQNCSGMSLLQNYNILEYHSKFMTILFAVVLFSV